MQVPRPAVESIRIAPPTAESRSVEVREARAALDARGLEALTVVLDAEAQLAVGVGEPDAGGRPGPGVLGRVLQRLEAAEVHGQLDRPGVTAQALVRDAHRDRRVLHRRAQCGGEAVLREHLRVDTARDALQLVERLVELPLELLDDRQLLGLELLAGEAEMDAEGDEALLGGVVQVAPDPAPLGVRGGEGARLRCAQLALQPAGLDGEQRRRGGGVDELGVLGESASVSRAATGQAVAPDLRPLSARARPGVRASSPPCGVAELPGGRIPVREPERRDRRAPRPRCRASPPASAGARARSRAGGTPGRRRGRPAGARPRSRAGTGSTCRRAATRARRRCLRRPRPRARRSRRRTGSERAAARTGRPGGASAAAAAWRRGSAGSRRR